MTLRGNDGQGVKSSRVVFQEPNEENPQETSQALPLYFFTCDPVVRIDFLQPGGFPTATLGSDGPPRVEYTPGGEIQRTMNLALEEDALALVFHCGVRYRHR
jgi:hypothetical protein